MQNEHFNAGLVAGGLGRDYRGGWIMTDRYELCAAVLHISFNSISLKGNDISLDHIRVIQLSRTKGDFTYICCNYTVSLSHTVSMIYEFENESVTQEGV